MGIAVPFPTSQPPGYEPLVGEPPFDPQVHLQLEEPDEVVLLSELGYDDNEISTKATPVALSTPFRVLSDAGVAVLLETARRLRPHAKPAGDRIENVLRGGCYRSRWLRDLCISQDLSNHLESIYGSAIAPHPMPVHLGHINYDPTNIDAAIDKWHHDTLPLDMVMMVTDPATVDGGRFEYFTGTKHQAAEMAKRDETPSIEMTRAPDFPGPGYGIALHGDMVVHRAGPLHSKCERISMVNGYVALDTSLDEQSRSADLLGVDDPQVLYTEWAKMVAWRSNDRLKRIIDELPFSTDKEFVIAQLESAIDDTQRAIAEMRSSQPELSHYGG